MKYSNDQLALLNTAEAARFLRVSQASIRRWSDSGLLPSQRVGRRRERRFRESDLRGFMDQESIGRPHEERVNIRDLTVTVPAHLCPFYSSDVGGLRLSLPFLAEGMRLGQPVFVAASGDVLDRYLKALDKETGVDIAAARKRGLFTVVEFEGRTATEAIAQWEGQFSDVLANNPTLIRIVGEMACERPMFESEDEMLRYEEHFEVMAQRYPVAVMCQYDVREFDGMALLRALKSHPDMYMFRVGTFLN